MGQLMRLSEAQLRQELTRQMGDVQLAATLSTISSREITHLQQTAASEVAATLKKAHQMVQAAVRAEVMTPDKMVATQYMTKAYLDLMFTITETGRTQIVNLLVTHSMRR